MALLPANTWAATVTLLSTLFDDLVQAQFRRSPESATNLGLDTGANADLRARLSDESAVLSANKARTKAALRRLETIHIAKRSPTSASTLRACSTRGARRERAKARMGARFDLKVYHMAVLRHGRLPLDVLREVDRWISA